MRRKCFFVKFVTDELEHVSENIRKDVEKRDGEREKKNPSELMDRE